MPRGETDALLDALRKKAGLHYVSDLHLPELRALVSAAAASLRARDYTAVEWNEAAAYITGQDCRFDRPEEAQAWLAVCRTDT